VRRTLFVAGLVFGASSSVATLCAVPSLDFRQRLGAQEAIERYYHAHQIGDTRSFEQAVPRSILQDRVQTYLKESVALERFWKTRVIGDMLQQELARMAAGSRMPERLRELYAALGNDPLLVREALARPALVDRLARNFYAYDSRIHTEEQREAEHIREQLRAGLLDPCLDHPRRNEVRVVRVEVAGESAAGGGGGPRGADRNDPNRLEMDSRAFDQFRAGLPARVGEIGPFREKDEAFEISVILAGGDDEVRMAQYIIPKRPFDDWWSSIEASLDGAAVEVAAPGDVRLPMPEGQGAPVLDGFCFGDDEWNDGSLDQFPGPRTDHKAVWTGNVMIVWGGAYVGSINVTSGGRYNPATDTWAPTSTTNAPANRRLHTAIWTGSVMVVWGGSIPARTDTGGRYDPVANRWTATTLANAPEARENHTAVWTGSRMIVWGGDSATTVLNTGGLYDPVNDSWVATSTPVGLVPRNSHTAVWADGPGVMIVWGSPSQSTGSRYNPATDTWATTTTTGAPSVRNFHSAVWTGTYMVIWGGQFGITYRADGGRYDPVGDTWLGVSTSPVGRIGHTAVWAGTRMIIWGGTNGTSPYLDSGGRYDPVSDTWTSTSPAIVPEGRRNHTAVWADGPGVMIVWGGINSSFISLGTGGRYDPGLDTWTPTSTADAPAVTTGHSAVWTGNQMVVWGGYSGGYLNTGGRYDPVLELWTPTNTSGAPTARYQHTAVWTGSQMLVWGGTDGGFLNSGGRYDPATNSWAAMSTVNAPTGRTGHTAVWTGNRMVVWGGGAGGGPVQPTGGLYNPATDTWAATSTTNAPPARSAHTAIWSGSVMIVWGGFNGGSYFDSGGRYDPAVDTWLTTSLNNVPPMRYRHTAVWTGTRMLIWGGYDGTYLSSGGIYDPGSDSWTLLSPAGAPGPRRDHTAVWTGHVMVVWGGFDGVSSLNSGSRYDPAFDTWTATSLSWAPSGRYSHTAVWMGSLMAVWGGVGAGGVVSGGGTYALGNSVDDDGDGFTECQGDCNDTNPAVFPGHAESCDSVDNDCNGIADDTAAPPAGIPSMTAVPGAVGTVLFWMPVGGATAYDLASGSLATLLSSGGNFTTATQSCLADNLAATSLEVADGTPATGDGRWYLARAVGCGAQGTYNSSAPNQVGLRDAEIEAAAASCP
jgi:N-acetylneuraminic acid mutarotase